MTTSVGNPIQLLEWNFDVPRRMLYAEYLNNGRLVLFSLHGEALFDLMVDYGFIINYDLVLGIVRVAMPVVTNGSRRVPIQTIPLKRFVDENIGGAEIRALIEYHLDKFPPAQTKPSWRKVLMNWFLSNPVF